MKTILGFVVVALLAGLVPFGLITLARSQVVDPAAGASDPGHVQAAEVPPPARQPDVCRRPGDASAFAGRNGQHRPQVKNEMVNDADNPHIIDNRYAPLKLGDELTYQRVVEGIEPQADDKPGYVKQIPLKRRVQVR